VVVAFVEGGLTATTGEGGDANKSLSSLPSPACRTRRLAAALLRLLLLMLRGAPTEKDAVKGRTPQTTIVIVDSRATKPAALLVLLLLLLRGRCCGHWLVML
jgi:hypothetical protein